MRIDWKFFLTLLIAFAGVAVPVWLWQADQSSKSISVKLATRIALQPKEHESITGMEISVDGSRLEKPHLVVFEVRNDGRKPIPATDFESPINIYLESETYYARANVTGRAPKDIEATLLFEPKGFILKPTLLNPGDIITITAITSGAPPSFNIKARVVGISNVVLEYGTTEKHNKIKLALLLLGAILSFVSFSLMSNFVVGPKRGHLRRRAAAFVGVVVVFPGAILLQTFLDEIGIQGFVYFMLCYSILLVPVSFLASALNRKVKSTESNTSDE